MEITCVKTAEQVDEIRRLFREYEEYLGVGLCFQDFEEELAGLPGKYAPPKGALLMAVDGHDVVGCVGVREVEEGISEMKRLYVRPQYRGRGIGRQLAQEIIEKAARLGYSLMRLDTLDRLEEAMKLYESLGFKRIQPYYDNPLLGVVYWELQLKKRTDG